MSWQSRDFIANLCNKFCNIFQTYVDNFLWGCLMGAFKARFNIIINGNFWFINKKSYLIMIIYEFNSCVFNAISTLNEKFAFNEYIENIFFLIQCKTFMTS